MRNFFDIPAVLKSKAMTETIEKPVVIRVNKFDEDSTKKFAEDLDKAQQTGQDVIPIVIDSLGGEAYAVSAMIAMIRQVKKPVATVAEGKALSCGAILLAFGTIGYRFAHEDAEIMLHELSDRTHGKTSDIKNYTLQLDVINKKLFQKLSKYCGHRPNYFIDIFDSRKNTDWHLTNAMAKKHNIIDHTGLPEIGVKVEVEHFFNFPGKNKGAKK